MDTITGVITDNTRPYRDGCYISVKSPLGEKMRIKIPKCNGEDFRDGEKIFVKYITQEGKRGEGGFPRKIHIAINYKLLN